MAYIAWFDEIGAKDVPLVGGKNASLGELYKNLSSKGIKIPYGFAITTEAYRYFLEYAGIKEKIEEMLSQIDVKNVRKLMDVGEKIRNIIINSPFPPDLSKEIMNAYEKLEEIYGKDVDVAVRSSATTEDLPTASFAGQQDTFLNIRKKDILKSVVKCFSSLFTDRAIAYRVHQNIKHTNAYLSVGIQKMVRADLASSGVMFTIDTETGFKNVIYITGVWGLGEGLVKGIVAPDEFYVFKPTLDKYKPIISKKLGKKEKMFVYGKEGIIEKEVDEEMKNKFVLSDEEILMLAKIGYEIERHYGIPMDIEWAKDGIDGEIYIVQARPETVHSKKGKFYRYKLLEKGEILVKGEAIGEKIGHGKAKVILDVKESGDFRNGDVLVTDMTDPDWEPIIKKASAVVTNRGGRTCHAAIISRELGIPAVIGTRNATSIIKNGMEITVDCSEGVGRVYKGILKYEVEELSLKKIPTRTKIMMNIAIPEKAFIQSRIPNDGVGLAREEFIISSYIGVHPMALVEYEKLKKMANENGEIRKIIKEIEEKTRGYDNKEQFFIDKLAMGIAIIAAAFYPKDVIVRFSDFKTNEYASLIGGKFYEPIESNPMLGWRGASRYYDEKFLPAFGLECKAIKKVRDEMGLKNVKVMIPFCRTPEEGKRVIEIMEKFGLKRNDIEIYVMCEIPSNVILAEEFAKIFDGFSIGSNDLTQLTLGLDRDSALVAHLFDERNEAVKQMISNVIKIAKKYGRKIGICGQAPSDFPEFAEFLVENGIDSISLNPDSVIKMMKIIAEKENKL